jgi:MoaA/NifB/PqqE/SkfB family radical SAM enzyme
MDFHVQANVHSVIEKTMQMSISKLALLGLSHGRNAIAEEIFIRAGYDATKPVTFYGLVNERCCIKCRYCHFWRMKNYVDEMTIDEWQKALTSIKEFVGRYSMNFSGGEPFLKTGFLDLMVWCHRNGISAGVTTSGVTLTRRNCEKLVSAEPFNVNISVDGPSAELHDYLRGVPGLFEKLSNGIRYLVDERERRGLKFPIIIKPTVNSRNFRQLPELVEWSRAIGATSVNLQPMHRNTQETFDELWIEQPDLPELEKVIVELISMKRSGAPILNPEMVLQLIPDHFREKKAPAETMPCRVGMRDFFVYTDGTVYMCDKYPAIGNIKSESVRDLWYGPRAKQIRHQTIVCDTLCLMTCVSQKTFTDKVKMGLQLLR